MAERKRIGVHYYNAGCLELTEILAVLFQSAPVFHQYSQRCACKQLETEALENGPVLGFGKYLQIEDSFSGGLGNEV